MTFSSAPEGFREAVTGGKRCLDLAFSLRGGRTVLDRRVFTYPLTLTRPYYRDTVPMGMASVVLQSVSGSLNPGDRLHQRIATGPQAAAYVTAQGATTVHGATPDRECSETLELVAEPDSLLEYMADLRILFPGAALSQSTSVQICEGATVVLCDGFVAHDPAGAHEPFHSYRSETRIRDATGRTLAMDCSRLSGTPGTLAMPSRFAAYGTLFVVTQRSEAETARLVEAIAAGIAIPEVYGAASALPNGCGVSARFAAPDGGALRRGIAAGWQAARKQLFGSVPGLLGQAAWQPMAG